MKNLIPFSLLMFLSVISTAFSPIEKGEKAPDFSAPDENGQTWKLSDQRADYLVIYFYPAAFTGGCTAQACAYRDHTSEYSELNAAIVGISGDDHKNLDKFKKHHNLNFTLLSDPEGKIAGLFGVPTRDGRTIEKEVDGQVLQLNRGTTTSRWTYVLDANKKVIYKDSEVSARTDPETVLKFIRRHDERKSCTPR